MKIARGNLYAASLPPADGERFESLARVREVEIERIVSSGVAPPAAYLQAQDEWVVLLRGDAVLEAAGERIEMAAGDWVLLPAGTPHTVARASAGALWLAVHVHPRE